MEGFLIRGWEIILPECDRTSKLARTATLAARWINEPHPVSNQSVVVRLGFHIISRHHNMRHHKRESVERHARP